MNRISIPGRNAWTVILAILCVPTLTAAIGQAADFGPSHVEVEPLRFALGPSGKIATLSMDRRGNLLVAIKFDGDDGLAFEIRVVSPEGKELATWKLDEGFVPSMLHGCDDGTVFIGGGNRLGLLDERGKVLKTVFLAATLDSTHRDAHVSGVTACDQYFFVAFGQGGSLQATEDIVRFDRDLGNPKTIVERQFGCCSHIDLDVRDDVLLVAENSRHRVNRYSFEGELLGTWGRRDRTNIEGFAACCNPVNFDFGPEGVLYTAESGIGRVKKYTPDGKYLGLVGYVDTTKFDGGSHLASISCYIPVEVSADGKRIYVMDVRAHIIRVLAEKE